MFLVFDTETTGLPDEAGRGKWEHPSQPWPVSFAGILLRPDLSVIREYHEIIRIPADVEIHPRALETHGITREMMDEKGVEPSIVFKSIMELLAETNVHMAYNLPFDDSVTKAFAKRLSHPNPEHLFGDSHPVDLLTLAKNYLRIPGGNQGYRYVKLFQAYRRITGVPMNSVYNAHDALDDVRACVDIYRAMTESVTAKGGILPEED